jgi:hypothetical protein
MEIISVYEHCAVFCLPWRISSGDKREQILCQVVFMLWLSHVDRKDQCGAVTEEKFDQTWA